MGKDICEVECSPQGATVDREPDVTLNLRSGYHKTVRIITGTSTVNMEIRNGKLGKVTQTEVIRT